MNETAPPSITSSGRVSRGALFGAACVLLLVGSVAGAHGLRRSLERVRQKPHEFVAVSGSGAVVRSALLQIEDGEWTIAPGHSTARATAVGTPEATIVWPTTSPEIVRGAPWWSVPGGVRRVWAGVKRSRYSPFPDALDVYGIRTAAITERGRRRCGTTADVRRFVAHSPATVYGVSETLPDLITVFEVLPPGSATEPWRNVDAVRESISRAVTAAARAVARHGRPNTATSTAGLDELARVATLLELCCALDVPAAEVCDVADTYVEIAERSPPAKWSQNAAYVKRISSLRPLVDPAATTGSVSAAMRDLSAGRATALTLRIWAIDGHRLRDDPELTVLHSGPPLTWPEIDTAAEPLSASRSAADLSAVLAVLATAWLARRRNAAAAVPGLLLACVPGTLYVRVGLFAVGSFLAGCGAAVSLRPRLRLSAVAFVVAAACAFAADARLSPSLDVVARVAAFAGLVAAVAATSHVCRKANPVTPPTDPRRPSRAGLGRAEHAIAVVVVGAVALALRTTEFGSSIDWADRLLIGAKSFTRDVPLWASLVAALGGGAMLWRASHDGTQPLARRVVVHAVAVGTVAHGIVLLQLLAGEGTWYIAPYATLSTLAGVVLILALAVAVRGAAVQASPHKPGLSVG